MPPATAGSDFVNLRWRRGCGTPGLFKAFSYEEVIKRDKTSLDLFWLRDESLEDSENLPDPAVLAAEIVEDLQAALDQFTLIATDLGGSSDSGERG